MIKGSFQEEGITIVNIYAPNIGALQYTRQTLTDIKGEIDSNTIIVGDFNTPLTAMDRSSKQKINKEAQALNDILDEMYLIDIFKTFHPNAEKIHLLLKCTWNILQDTGYHVLGHTNQALVNLRKLKSFQASSLTTTLWDYTSITRKTL